MPVRSNNSTIVPPFLLPLALAAFAAASAAPAEAQGAGCGEPAQPRLEKKRGGLGGLGGLARGSGLKGSLGGMLRGGKGDLTAGLKDAARAAAERAASDAAEGLACAATSGAGENGSDSSPPEAAQERPKRKAAQARLRYPSDIAVAEDWKARKAAFDAFGKVKCFGCEGGYTFDGWPAWPSDDDYARRHNGTADRLGSWPVGHVFRWKGAESNGSVAIVSEETVDGFRCRRLKYQLQGKGGSAERPGLLCWGLSGPYAGKESWVEVF